MRWLAVLTLATCAFAQPSAPPAPASGASWFDKTAFEAYVRHVELYVGPVDMKIGDPQPSRYLPGFFEVTVRLSYNGGTKDELYYVAKDGTIVQGEVYNLRHNPFEANLAKLDTAGAPSFGTPGAPVTIVEFGDLECPDCKMEAPLLRQLPQMFPNQVHVFFKDYPLESIHPWSRAAAIAGRCVLRQGQPTFWKFYDWIYDNQEGIQGDTLKSKIMDWAGKNSVDTAQLSSCIDTKATEPEVDRSIEEGRELQLKGTPTLFINGRKIGGLDGNSLQQVIQIELDYVAKHPPAK